MQLKCLSRFQHCKSAGRCDGANVPKVAEQPSLISAGSVGNRSKPIFRAWPETHRHAFGAQGGTCRNCTRNDPLPPFMLRRMTAETCCKQVHREERDHARGDQQFQGTAASQLCSHPNIRSHNSATPQAIPHSESSTSPAPRNSMLSAPADTILCTLGDKVSGLHSTSLCECLGSNDSGSDRIASH